MKRADNQGIDRYEVVVDSGSFLLVAAPSHAIVAWTDVVASVFTHGGKWVVELLVTPWLAPEELDHLAFLSSFLRNLRKDQRYSIVKTTGTS